MTESKTSWRFGHLLLFHALIALLLGSLFCPYTKSFWTQIDVAFFHFLNEPLAHNHSLRVFWALANHRFADWLEDLMFLALCIAAIWKLSKQERIQKVAQFIFCALFIATTILLVNRVLCRDILRLRRDSPTLMVGGAIYLSDFITSIPIKVDSSKSFPGDHATTALLFTCMYSYFVRGRLAILAVLYGVFLCLPRLAIGCHWLSDVIVGSGSIALFVLSWAFFTPLADRCIAKINTLFKLASLNRSS